MRLLYAKAVNWSLRTYKDWQQTEYTVYTGGTVRIKKVNGLLIKPKDQDLIHGRFPEQVEQIRGRLTPRALKELKELIARLPEANTEIHGCDGTGWTFWTYDDTGSLNYEFTGYTYDDPIFEGIQEIIKKAIQ